MLKKRKSATQRREEIFYIIAQIIAEEGLSKVSTLSVAKRLGVTQPAIYKYFKNKDEMIVYFLNTLDEKLKQIVSVAKEKKSIREQIKEVYKQHLKFVEDTKILPRVIFSDTVYLGDKSKQQALQKAIFNFMENLKKLAQQAIKQGEMKELDPEIVVRFYIGSIISSALKWMLSDMKYPLSNDAEMLAKHFEIAFFKEKKEANT